MSSPEAWHAAARALETEQPDALYEDPLAETLAGTDAERNVICKQFPALSKLQVVHMGPGACHHGGEARCVSPGLALRVRGVLQVPGARGVRAGTGLTLFCWGCPGRVQLGMKHGGRAQVCAVPWVAWPSVVSPGIAR